MNLPVVTSDDPLHVGHRGVADLHLLPVVMVVQETVPFEVFVNESEEGSSNICLYCVGPRRIEPNDVSSPSFLPFGFLVDQLFFEPSILESLLVDWFLFLKDFLGTAEVRNSLADHSWEVLLHDWRVITSQINVNRNFVVFPKRSVGAIFQVQGDV